MVCALRCLAQYFELGKDDDSGSATAAASAGAGLYLQLPSGELVSPTFPPNALLLMGGEGATRCARPRNCVFRNTTIPRLSALYLDH